MFQIQVKLLPLVLTALVAGVAIPAWLQQDRMTGAKPAPAPIPAPVGQTSATGGSIVSTEISRGPRGRKEMALTLDAGSEADSFPPLLAMLDRMNVRATFFLSGRWVLRYPQYADMLASSAHTIGNHSWAHPEYTRLSEADMARDLLAADKILEDLMGRSAKPFFRPPYGDRDARVLKVLGQHGYGSVYWTIDTLDSMEPRKSPDFIVRRILDRSDDQLDGAIVLSHVGYPETVEALPEIIAKLRARGFTFVTLRDWFGEGQTR